MNIASTLHASTLQTLSSTTKKILGVTVLGATLLFAPSFQTAAHAQVFFSVNIAPPAIPLYEQPLCPGDGYVWTPGYWAWTDEGYQWVDGAWVVAPYTGALWTPGYWGYDNGAYLWNAGYWGRNVGYYGGINYGFGYFGTGFYGGYWGGNRFFYNRAYNHFDRGFRGEYYEHREHDHDGRPGGEGYARNDRGFHDDHRGSFAGGRDGRDEHRDDHHDGDHRNTFNDNTGNRGNDQGRGMHDDHREALGGNRQANGGLDQQRGLTGPQNNVRQSYNGNTNQQNGYRPNFPAVQDNRGLTPLQHTNIQPGPTPNQSLPGNQNFGGNRGNFQNNVNRQQPQQGFAGNQNPNVNRGAYNPQPYRPASGQGFGGNPRESQGGFQSNAVRSNSTPAMPNNGGGRGFSGGNVAPAAPQQSAGGFHGGAPANNPGGNQGGGFHGGDHGGHH